MNYILMMHYITMELRKNQQPLSLDDLKQRLQVEHTVLEEIVAKLVDWKYLVEVHHDDISGPCACECALCPLHRTAGPCKTYCLAKNARQTRSKPMINVIIDELKRNQHSLSLKDLSQRLQIDHSVLEGMVTMLVRRGDLVEVHPEEKEGPCECGGNSCPNRMAASTPVTYRLVEHKLHRNPF